MGPQLENGYTRIANEILEILAKTPISATQFRILMVILRYTYGYGEKTAKLSIGFIAKETGISERQAKRELNRLIESKIIKVEEEATFTRARTLSFNKYYNEWHIWDRPEVVPAERQDGTDLSGGDEIDERGQKRGEGTNPTPPEGTKLSPPQVTNLSPNKKNNKENTKKDVVDVIWGTDLSRGDKKDTSHDKVPSQCHEGNTQNTVEIFMRQVDRYYTYITGRLLSPKDMMAITQLAQETTNFDIVKEAIDEAVAKYKPTYQGDRIRSFSYFIPIIKAKLAAQRRRGEYGTSGIDNTENNTENDPYAGLGITL